MLYFAAQNVSEEWVQQAKETTCVQRTLCLNAVWCEYLNRSRDTPPEKNVIILHRTHYDSSHWIRAYS